ncbi:MAG: NADH-quinone oxidoreductase subunit J [Pseudomonadota bacterium]
MPIIFYLVAAIAVFSTLRVVTGANPVHALLYLVVSLLAMAMIFMMLGAPFAAMLEIIIYAGAIMVLFVFVVMILNLGEETVAQERHWLQPMAWLFPGGASAFLLGVLVVALIGNGLHPLQSVTIDPKQVGISLFGTYLLLVELVAMLLLATLVAAWHVGRTEPPARRPSR